MRKLKLAFVYDHRYFTYNGKIYSEGAFDKNVWDRFLESFDEITVVGSIYEGNESLVENLNEVTHDRVHFYHLPYINGMSPYLKNLFFTNEILKQKLSEYDAVVVRLPGEISNNAFYIARKMGIPVGVEAVGCPWDSYRNHGSLRTKILAPLARYRMARIIRKASHVVYVTEFFLQKRYPTSGLKTNVSNVDIGGSDPEVLERKLSSLGAAVSGNRKFKIGLSGSCKIRYKGHDILVRAIALVKDEIPDFTIEMIGPGDPTWIIDLAKSLGIETKLNILGKLPMGEPVVAWLDSLDLYIHPSKQEGLPRSVIEAMTRACPVLASSIAGIPELLEKRYLHDPGDYKTLSIHIRNLLNSNFSEWEEMAQKNFIKSESYSRDVLAKKRKSFWKQFAESIN